MISTTKEKGRDKQRGEMMLSTAEKNDDISRAAKERDDDMNSEGNVGINSEENTTIQQRKKLRHQQQRKKDDVNSEEKMTGVNRMTI